MLVSIFALIAEEEAPATQSVLHSPASNKASMVMARTLVVDHSLTTTEGDAPPTRSLSVATGLEPLSPSRGRKRKRNRSKRKKTEEALRTAAARGRESNERALEKAGARVYVVHSGGGTEEEEREKEVRVVTKRIKKEAASGLVNVKPQSIELKTEVVAVVEMSIKHANDSTEAPQANRNERRGDEGDKCSNGTEQRGSQHSQHPHSETPTAMNETLLEQLLLRSSDLLIGAAMYDITGPAAEVGMFGYAKAGQLTSGIHMRLRARAFAFHHPATNKHCVYVVADVGMISEWVRQAVLSRLTKHAKLASSGDAAAIYSLENVMISATHTHCSPGGLSHYFIYSMHPPLRGADRQNFECVVDGIVEAIVRAHSNLQPAFIRVAKGNCLGASVNRSEDAYMANPREEREKYEHDTDKEMTLWRFDGVNGYPIGMINWFAVHPTSMGNWYTLITGDNKV